MNHKCVRDWIGEQLYCDALSFGELEDAFAKDYVGHQWIVLSDAIDAMLEQGLIKTFKLRTKAGSNEDFTVYYTTKETQVWIDE